MPKYGAIIALVLIGAILLGTTSLVRYRKSVLGGTWYPATVEQLDAAINQYLNHAPAADPPGKMIGAIVPHAPWPYSGKLSGQAFQHVVQGAYDRVIVITQSHTAKFNGCSIAAVQFYRTPFGPVPVDIDSVQKISWNSLVTRRSVSYDMSLFASGMRTPIHESEHGIETVLPFLQNRLGAFWLIPIVVGDFKNYRGKNDAKLVESVADSIRPLINDRTLVVATAHFTRYGRDYGFYPFDTDVALNIERLDLQAMRYVIRRDVDGLFNYLHETENPLGDPMALALFMEILPARARGVLIDRTTSRELTGSEDSSTTYATLGFFDPTLPIPEPTPFRQLPGARKPE